MLHAKALLGMALALLVGISLGATGSARAQSAPAVASPTKSAPASEIALLIYLAGDEADVQQAVQSSLQLIGKVATARSHSTRVIVAHDALGVDPNYRYVLDQDSAQATTLVPVPEATIRRTDPSFHYGEKDSGDPRTLQQFLRWAVRAYPAQHYVLVLSGHSWGVQGYMQDFFYEGKKHKRSTIIKNYELRRIMEELYREERANIPEGSFDALYIDGCNAGLLEIALEIKDVFRYFGSSSVETPYYGLPYDKVLLPFVAEADALPKGDAAATHRLLEEGLLKRITQLYVRDHIPGGQMALQEAEYTPIDTFALRTSGLTAVADALRGLMQALTPTSLPAEYRQGQLQTLERLVDADGNADLLALSQALTELLGQRYNATHEEHWLLAQKQAEALTRSLGYHTTERATAPIALQHPTAQGAWVHVEVDPLEPSAEKALCNAVRVLAMQNRHLPGYLPTFSDPKTPQILANDLACDSRPSTLRLPEMVNAAPITRLFNVTLTWPKGVAARYTGELLPSTARPLVPRKRTLSLWFPRQTATAPLSLSPVLSLPGARTLRIEYVSGLQGSTPQDHSKEVLQTVIQDCPLYTEQLQAAAPPSPATLPQELYIAEAHSAGTVFKQGLGIYFRPTFSKPVLRYMQGRAPVEQREPSPYGVSIEAYLAGLQRLRRLNAPVYFGADFYRLHRLTATGWPDFLFGPPAKRH